MSRFFPTQKEPRFNFVRFTCGKCRHTQVLTTRMGQMRVACAECKFPHAVRAEEIQQHPHERK